MKVSLLFLLLVSFSLVGQKSLKAGDMAPPIRISEYLQNEPTDKSLTGKFIVLDFWATWCAPCLSGIPKLNAMQEKYKSRKDVVFIALTYESAKVVKPTLDRIDFKTIVASDLRHETFKAFGLEDEGYTSVPRLVLIDKSGKIYFNDFGVGDLADLMERFLSGKAPDIKPISLSDIEQKNTTGLDDLVEKQQKMSQGFDFTFELVSETDDNASSMMVNALRLGKLNLMNHTLEEIFSNIYELPVTGITLPEGLRGKKYSLVYRNPEKITIEEQRALLKKILCARLKLKEVRKIVPSEIYALRLIDKTKLVPSVAENAHSGINETHLIVGGPVSDLVGEIYKYLEIPVIDETGLTGNYEFLLKAEMRPELLAKEVESYGLSLTKEQREIEVTSFEYKKLQPEFKTPKLNN